MYGNAKVGCPVFLKGTDAIRSTNIRSYLKSMSKTWERDSHSCKKLKTGFQQLELRETGLVGKELSKERGEDVVLTGVQLHAEFIDKV